MEPGMLPHMCVFFVMWLGSDAVLVKGGSLSKSTPVPLVALDVYYETLCPDCMKFIVEQLYPTVKAVGAVMNISLIPYGFATVSCCRTWTCDWNYANLLLKCRVHWSWYRHEETMSMIGARRFHRIKVHCRGMDCHEAIMYQTSVCVLNLLVTAL